MRAGGRWLEVGMTEFAQRSETMREALARAVEAIDGETVTLRTLIRLIGEHGLLFIAALLSIPFLIPVSIPGVSTVFGLGILLIAIGITLNRAPWLPDRLQDRPISTDKLKPVLRRGMDWLVRIEKVIRPRLTGLTEGMAMQRVNGLALILGAGLLMVPLGLVPFSNTLPALAILFLCVGVSQRDGWLVLAGHAMNVLTIIYFLTLALAAYAAGRGLLSIFGG
jgi:hypothetical protein